jgi:multiple sugar transport system permease protein
MGDRVVSATSNAALSAPEGEPVHGSPLRRFLGRRVLPRIILVIMCLIYFIPFYWMVVTALKSPHEMTVFPPHVWPHLFAWKNFVDAVNYMPFFRFFLNSVIITAGMTIGAVISNPIIAYGFSRIEWPGRDALFYVAVATLFIPFPVVMVALFDIFSKLHWVNTYLPLIVPTFFGQAFYLFLVRQFLMGLPKELSDAATMDGASEFQVFLRVIIPLAKPAIAVVAIFAAVNAWNEFLTPLIYLSSEHTYPLAIGLQFFRQTHNVAFNLLMAASTMVVIPVIILFLLFQRFFVEGVTVGSVKG